jgi:perosamine synthetase
LSPTLRSLPPTAAPVSWGDFAAALRAGPEAAERFATALAGYLGVWACYPTSSGRAALALLLGVLRENLGAGRDEVIMPAYTCPALARVTLDAGLRPRLVDVNPGSLGMDDAGLWRAAGERTLAIIHVHPFGLPLGMDAARAAATESGAALIEDAAQALGARLRPPEGGQRTVRAGAAATYGLLSFGPGKPLSTGGGGAICVSDPPAAARLERAWRELPEASSPGTAAGLIASRVTLTPGGWPVAVRLGARRFSESETGMRYRMARISSFGAAIGLRALPRLDGVNARRVQIAHALGPRLADLDFLWLPSPAAGSGPIYLRLPVVFKDADARDGAYDRLTAAGLGAGRMYLRPLSEQYATLVGPFPGAEALAIRLLTLPTHAYVTDEDVMRIAGALGA